MGLAKEDEDYIKAHLGEWLQEAAPRPLLETDLLQRMVRVEEELAHQRELMQQGFRAMEKRFEQVDKRFEEMRADMDKRFEQVDKRFEQVDKRFEQVDKRFEEMRADMDKRFEQVERRFEQLDRRFDVLTRRIDRFMIWSFGLTVTVGGLVVAILRLWPPGA